MDLWLTVLEWLLKTLDSLSAIATLIAFLVMPFFLFKALKGTLSGRMDKFLRVYFWVALIFALTLSIASESARIAALALILALILKRRRVIGLSILLAIAYGYLGYSIFSGWGKDEVKILHKVDERAFTHILLTDNLKTLYTKRFMKTTALHEKLRQNMLSVPNGQKIYRGGISFVALDSWERAIKYIVSEDYLSYRLVSAGPDGKFESVDDIYYPEN